jgi:transposase
MFDGATFWSFLRQLENASQEAGRRVIVIIDNAKYHHAKLHAGWRQEQQGRFSLDFLPPYSPELNPIERVWKRTRRNRLHNVYFPKLTLVVEAVEGQFAKWSEPNAELARLCKL